MKKIYIFLALLLPMVASAEDFSEPNGQGVTIYYKYTNNYYTEVAVSCQGNHGYNVDGEYSGDVIIPETVTHDGETYPVTGIGDEAFDGCDGLTSVTIPNTVTSIGENAFNACQKLTSVIIPNSVTSIGKYAFQDCESLESLTIGKSVASIGRGAFYVCSKFLTSISVDPDNSYYNSQDDCNALIETASKTLILGCKNTVIPNSVTSIGESAFTSCEELTSLTIPSSVTSIADYAFFLCSGLTDIYCYAFECPSATLNTFREVGKSKITLHVLDISESLYKNIGPWDEFGSVVGDIISPQCATPTITYRNGKLLFECETEDVEFNYSYQTPDGGDSNSSEVTLPTVYTVTVTAKKAGYKESEPATKDVDIRGQASDLDEDGNVTIADAMTTLELILNDGHYMKEMLTNGNCNGTTDGWTVENHETARWTGFLEDDGFYSWQPPLPQTKLTQVVDLSENGIDEQSIDNGKALFQASVEIINTQWSFQNIVQVELYNADNELLGTEWVLYNNNSYATFTRFQTATSPLKPGTRKLKYIIEAMSLGSRQDMYGPRFRNASMKVYK